MDRSTIAHKQTRLEFYRPKPDGHIDPAGEAGWYMQRERERMGLLLEDVSAATGIHAYHLEAIENGDLVGLPARSEALGMIGTYAEFLGFDPQPLILHFANFLPRPSYPDPNARKKKPAPLTSAKIIDFSLSRRLRGMTSGVGGVVMSCLAAVMLFGAASYWLLPAPQTSAPPQAAEVAAVPAKTPQRVDNLPVASTSKISEEPLTDDQATDSNLGAAADRAANSLTGLDELLKDGKVPTDKTATDKTASDKAATDNTASDQKATDTATPQPAQDSKSVKVSDLATGVSNLTPRDQVQSGKVSTPPDQVQGGKVLGAGNADAHLVLTAKAPVWLRIDDPSGNIVVTTTLNAGDSYRVPNKKGLVIIARDGGRIAYSIDGKAMGDLGKPGEILVGRSLDLNKLAAR